MRQEKNGIVNVYELSEEWDDFTVLSFEKRMRNGLILCVHAERDSQ